MSEGEEATRRLGEALASELAPDGVLLLEGDLGSGKTVLVQGLARGLGIDPREVQSPSFTLVREYVGAGGHLLHVDLYRLESGGVHGLGLEELLAGRGVKAVEWAERLPFPVPGALRLRLRRAPGAEILHVEESIDRLDALRAGPAVPSAAAQVTKEEDGS